MNEVINSTIYQAIFSHIPEIELKLLNEDYLLLIPNESTLPNSYEINKQFLLNHILIPLKQKQQQQNEDMLFKTMDDVSNLLIQIVDKQIKVYSFNEINDKDQDSSDDDDDNIKREIIVDYKSLIKDNKPERTIPILFEERFYKQKEYYSVLYISRPTIGKGQVPLLDDGSQIFDTNRSTNSWNELIFKVNDSVINILQNFDEKILKIESIKNRNEILLLLEKFIEETYSILVTSKESNKIFGQAIYNSEYKMTLLTFLESRAMVILYSKIFFELSGKNQKLENQLQMKLHSLRIKTILNKEEFLEAGISKTLLNLDLTKPVAELQLINDYKSPFDKFQCINKVVKLIADSYISFKSVLSADDMLPTLLLVLVSAAPSQILANLEYMENFTIYKDMLSGEVAYNFMQLSASIQFLSSNDSLLIQDEYTQVKQQHYRKKKSSSNTMMINQQEEVEQQKEASITSYLQSFFPFASSSSS